MKLAQIRALVQEVGQHVQLTEFRLHQRVLFLRPIQRVLRGFCFEEAGTEPGAFFVSHFFMPLYIPHDSISLSFGRRMGEGDTWRRWQLGSETLSANLANCMRDSLPMLQKLANVSEVLIELALRRSSRNPHVLEAIACSLLAAGDFASARAELNELMGLLDVRVSWQVNMLHRCSTLLHLLDQSPEMVAQQLSNWEHWTLQQLRIEAD